MSSATTRLKGFASRASRSTDARRIAALTGLALLLRVAFVLVVERAGFPAGDLSAGEATRRLMADGLFNDAFFYHRTADLLAAGEGFSSNVGVPTAQWPPAFPVLLSFLYRLVGPEPLAGELLNALLGALTVPLVYLLGRRMFGRREALLAGGALAVFPGQILWTDVLLSETLFAFVLVAFFLVLATVGASGWSALGLGGAIGLAALTRGEALLLVPAVLAAWAPALPRGRLAVRGAVLVAAAALVVAPWTVRNALTMDAFIPLSTNSSTTLWSGHNAGATGAQNYAGRELLDRIPQRGKDREVQEGRLLRREALEYMVSHPLREAALVPLKLVNLNRGDSYALEWVNAGPAGKRPLGRDLLVPVRVASDLSYYALLAVFLAAVVLMRRTLWRIVAARAMLVLFAGTLVMFGFVYYGNYRYRVPLEPLMILLAAPLVVRVWEERRAAAQP